MASSECKALKPSVPESLKSRVLLENKALPPQSQDLFSVITYNILADCHAQQNNASYADPQYLNTEFRYTHILKELEYLDGDIVCLQEVSPTFYHYILKDWFTSHGFGCHFMKRTRDSHDEGCATFFRTEKFECKNVELVDLKNLSDTILKSVTVDECLLSEASERYDIHDIAIITELRRLGTDHVITVANTHLLFGDFVKPDVQILEITCLKYVLKQKYGQSHAILCGDFNIFPDTSPYIFATTGSLSVEQWESVCEQAKIQDGSVSVLRKLINTSDSISHFCSSYKTVKDVEPEITCVDNIWRCCLDYIFYSITVTTGTSSDDPNTTRKQRIFAQSRLVPMKVLDTPPLAKVLESVPPSDVYPSDHFPLRVEFAFREGG